jgi:hypothetical protein
MLTITEKTSTWSTARFGEIEIGGFGPTTRGQAEMRWYWSGQSRYGYCATRDEAVAELVKLIPTAKKSVATDRAAQADFEALPAELQVLKSNLAAAEFERQRVWGRQPFNNADYAAAADEFDRAYRAFHVAHDRWLAQREAA